MSSAADSTANDAGPKLAGHVTNRRGEKLALHSWAAPAGGAAEEGIALLFHGYAVNARYPTVQWFAEVLLSVGLQCYAADMIGHGDSEGTVGLIPPVQGLTEDGVDVLTHVQGLHPKAKIFLCGTSMGGAISVSVSLHAQKPVDGLVLLAPMMKQNQANIPAAPVVMVLRALAWLAPSWALISSNATDPSVQYTDPERRKQATEAPQYSGKMRLGTAATLLGITEELQTRLEDVTTPFFAAVGTKEVVVDASGPEELFQRARTPAADKVLKKYPEAQHGLLAEPQPLRNEIEEDIRGWVRSRLAATGA